MKPGITFSELKSILDARIRLMICQYWLWEARCAGQPDWSLRVFERHVGDALDRLWEAQQRAA